MVITFSIAKDRRKDREKILEIKQACLRKDQSFSKLVVKSILEYEEKHKTTQK